MIRRLVGIIGVFLVTALLFSPFIFRGQIPIAASYMLSWYEPWKSLTASGGTPTIAHKPVVDDAFRELYPLRVLATAIVKQGQLPLWNPYNAAGTPLLATMHPGYLTPFGIFFLFLPPSIAWGFYLLLQPIILGLATYWYGIKLKLSERASLLAAVTLILSGFTVVRLEYGEFLYVLSGIPLLLGIVEGIKNKQNAREAFVVPLIVAIMMLSGQPLMIIYTLLVFALYGLVRLSFLAVLRLGMFALLGAGIAAIQLVPSLELLTFSTISRQTNAFIFDRFLLPFQHLITIVIPNYFGNQATYNYFGPHDYTETIAYVGSIPLFLAAVALWKQKSSSVVRFFAILVVVSILTTVRWAGAQLFFALPIPVLSADVPSRVFVLSTFGISMLAGFGFSEWERLRRKETLTLLGIAGLVVGAILFTTFVIYRRQVPCPTPNIPQCRLVSLRTSLIETVIFALFAAISLLFVGSRQSRQRCIVWLPIVLVAAIGLYNAYKFLPFAPRDMIFPSVSVITALQKVGGVDRYFALGNASIRANLTTIYGLSSPEYFDPLHVRRYAELVSFANTGDRGVGISRSDVILVPDATPSAAIAKRRERFLDMTSAKYLVRRKDELPVPPTVTPVWEDGTWYITIRPSALPRIYVVDAAEVVPDSKRLLTRLFDPAFDIQNAVLLEKTIPQSVVKWPQPQSTVLISRYTSSSVEVAVTVPGEGILVLTDTYYPGWRAFVDGKETPIYRANYTFRAVSVPQGTHTVRFIYQPQSVRWGAIISGVSLVIWLAIILIFPRKNVAEGRHS